jgi:hypothetical protein
MYKKSLIFIITIIYCNLSYADLPQGNYPQNPQGHYSQSFTWSPAKQLVQKKCEDRLEAIEKEEKAYLIYEKDFIYHIEDLWDKWEKIQCRFPLKKRFLLVKKEWSTDNWKEVFPKCKAVYDVFLVDVLKTAIVIRENYDLFKEAVGYDFDPALLE